MSTTYQLGDRTVRRLGYGAMQLAGPGVFGPPRDREAALAVLRDAVALGVNHIDTSDFYGPHITNQLIREALHPYPDDLVIVTKIGARRDAQGAWLPATSAEELRQAVHELYGHSSEVIVVSGGALRRGNRYVVRVVRDGEALARQTGLLDSRGRPVRGLPPQVVSASVGEAVAAWRGAFLARGSLTEPGRSSALEVTCPGPEAALDIFRVTNAKLASFKRLRALEFVHELPKTISGKIRRVQLRRLEHDGVTDDPYRGVAFTQADFPELKGEAERKPDQTAG